MSATSRIAELLLVGSLSVVCVIGAPPGQGFSQAPVARIPSYAAPSHFPAPLGLRPTTSGFTGINPGALSTRPYGTRNGYSGGVGSYGRNSRGLPFSYFFTPYYYPGLYDAGYDSGDYSGPAYYGAPDPVSDSLAASQGYLGRQIQQLSEQVDQLQNAQQSAQVVPGNTQKQQPQPERPPVILILQSGQQLQVKNYAIMAQVFWDFTSPIAKKIPLGSINIPASVKATEETGGEFPVITQ